VKTIVIIGDGMSDLPIARLDGKTPLMVARKPHIDRIAREGRQGLLRTIGETGPADSAVANLAVLGYDQSVAKEGRAVLEAASMGIDIGPGDVALRCNLISLDGADGPGGPGGLDRGRRIRNHSAGHIPTRDAAELIADLDAALGGGRGPLPVRFHPGVSYRHLLVLGGGWASSGVVCAPPHDHVGGRVADLLPHADPAAPRSEAEAAARTAQRLVALHTEAAAILADHPVNRQRRAAGLDTADSIWTWSPGRRPTLPTLHERFGVRGAVISAVDLVMGLGVYAGLDLIRVPGATGLHDTNYEGKAQACLDALRDHDFVYLHVEATDEAAHARDLELKIRCIEYLDGRLVRPLLAGLAERDITSTIAVLPDHPTPVETGQHGRDPVPVAILRPGQKPDTTTHYDEVEAARGALGHMQGDEFIRRVLS
jgi:2,3-bisphosphoglycerate-independent phosphoglycerate mutase